MHLVVFNLPLALRLHSTSPDARRSSSLLAWVFPGKSPSLGALGGRVGRGPGRVNRIEQSLHPLHPPLASRDPPRGTVTKLDDLQASGEVTMLAMRGHIESQVSVGTPDFFASS